MRIFLFDLLAKYYYYYNDEIKGGVMRGARRRMHEEKLNAYRLLVRKPEDAISNTYV